MLEFKRVKKRTAHKSKIEYENTWNDALKILETDMVKKDKDLIEILDSFL